MTRKNKVNHDSAYTILPCKCKSVDQDEEHGDGRRLHFWKKTWRGSVWVCSVCKAEKTVKITDEVPNK